jgi:AraC-like DNA-binding protein
MAEHITKYEFKDNLPIEFEIVDIALIYKQNREMLTSPHRTGFYHILWIQKGPTEHMVDFNAVPLKENSLLFLDKDIVHSYNNQPFEGKSILFTEAFFCTSPFDMQFLKNSLAFNNPYSISTISLTTDLTSVFNALITLMEKEVSGQNDAITTNILKNYLHSFILNAERELVKQGGHIRIKGADNECVVLLKDLLEKNFRVQKQVKFYASGLSITEKRLNAAAFKVLGKTVKQVINDRVMLEAKRLLAHTNDTIKNIGYTLGFEEPTYFIKYFKNHYDGTPADFREKLADRHGVKVS